MSLCRNCATPLHGRYCHVCGQDSAPARALLSTLAELASLDLRLPRSLRILAQPGELARRYASGRHAPYVPPLRLAIASSLVLLVAWTIRLPEAGAPTAEGGLAEDLSYLAGSAAFALALVQLALLQLLALAVSWTAPRSASGYLTNTVFVLYLHAVVNIVAIGLILLSFVLPYVLISNLAALAMLVVLGPYLFLAVRRFHGGGWLRTVLIWSVAMTGYVLVNFGALLITVLAAIRFG